MRCPFCKEDQDKVVDSRASEEGYVTRRRRECLACSRRYTTYERFEDSAVRVVKKGGERQPFDRRKVRAGLEKACGNLPVSAAQIEEVTDRIERQIVESNEREVSTDFVGEMVMAELRALHEVAYVRFASVYRKFKDVTEFMQVLQEVMRTSEQKADE